MTGMGRGDVDDAADALLDHLWQHRFAAEPGAVQINSEAATPIFFGHDQRITEHVDPGAVDQHIDAPVQLNGAFGHGMQVGLMRDIRLQRLHVVTLLTPVHGNRFDFFRLNITDHQFRLLRGERRNNGFADALGGAGQQHDLVFQTLAPRRRRHRRQGKRFSHGSGLLFRKHKKTGHLPMSGLEGGWNETGMRTRQLGAVARRGLHTGVR
ncbi:hypothetical protein D3C78_1282020 [compost metagenome]